MKRSETRAERTAQLAAAAVRRSEEARTRSMRALTTLEARGETISYASVASEAGVSASYLRKHPELSARIAASAGSGRNIAARRASTDPTAASLRTKLAVVTERLRSLDGDNARLRRENEALRGEVIELRRLARVNGKSSAAFAGERTHP
jgi:hypothetical protein